MKIRTTISFALAFALLTTPAAPSAAAGARHVVVVNLSGTTANAVFDQGLGPVAHGQIADRRDADFSMPEGVTGVVVSNAGCRSHRLVLPTHPSVRVVLDKGCYLSIQ